MTMPLTLPDWMPWWLQLVVLMAAILLGLAFLAMPFVVFGLRGRLEFIEAQLDDVQAELRMLASRIPEPISAARYQAMRASAQPEVRPEPLAAAPSPPAAAAEAVRPAAPAPWVQERPAGPATQTRTREDGAGVGNDAPPPYAAPEERRTAAPSSPASSRRPDPYGPDDRPALRPPMREDLRAEPREERWTPRPQDGRHEPRLRWPPR